MIGGSALAAVPFGALYGESGVRDVRADRPFTLEVNGVDWGQWLAVDSLSIEDTLGQPMTCEFALVNPTTVPAVGSIVRVLYYAAVLFAGVLVRRDGSLDTALSVARYGCSCNDWSQILLRHALQRNFTNMSTHALVSSLLQNELAGEGLSIRQIDLGTTLPFVEVQQARAFDVLRDMAGATGQSMYVDADKGINFQATTNPLAPKPLNYTTVMESSLVEDLEAYRNVQTVVGKGTVPDGTSDVQMVVTETVQNAAQITARAALEGGSGRYEAIETIVHPTSNEYLRVKPMARGYAQLRLAVSGVPRQTLSCRVRGYEFRAGQFASVDLAALGIAGTWLIQRARMQESAIREIQYELELTQSSSQLRAYESWLNIVKAAKIVVQFPGSGNQAEVIETYVSPGTFFWTVPANVTFVEFTVNGPGASAGGWWDAVASNHPTTECDSGGDGGSGGRAIVTLEVTTGQVFTLVIGAAASGHGTNQVWDGLGDNTTFGGKGSDSTDPSTYISLSGSIRAQGNGGKAGFGCNTNTAHPGPYPDINFGSAPFPAKNSRPGENGAHGGGMGDIVTLGGAATGGINRIVSQVDVVAAPINGSVIIRY